MSVIVKNSIDKSFRAYVKGSPEKILELCIPQSIPHNFHECLEMYTQKGLRVIALAMRFLDKTSYIKIQKTKRDEIEYDL
jgi:cation-transporting ATPase 13A3/4/5